MLKQLAETNLRIVLVALSLILSSCAGKLRPDTTISAISAGYPTAEIKACGQHVVGGVVCATDGTVPTEVTIKGYYKGTVRLDSEKCNVSESRRYENSEEVSINVTLPEGQNSCNLDIVVAPEYPNEKRSAVEINPLKGRVYLRRIPSGSTLFSTVVKLPEQTEEFIHIPYSNRSNWHVIFRGCDSEYDDVVDFSSGTGSIKLSEITDVSHVKDCQLEGVVLGPDLQRVSIQVWVYDKSFAVLSVPSISFKRRKISVDAETGVSVIAVNNSFSIGNTATFDFDRSAENILRIITVGGRVVLGSWVNGAFVWTQ